jgi:tRNA(Arg) A34 adenosine deaminase TadA
METACITEADLVHLRRAIALSQIARERGNGPFGAVLVNRDGVSLLEAQNTRVTDRDCTAHAEANLLREATRRFEPDVLAQCTVYASTEPCAMCAGAIFWSGVKRVVFALSNPGLYALAGNPPNQLRMRCADVLASGVRQVEVIGPAIEPEAWMVFEGYFA